MDCLKAQTNKGFTLIELLVVIAIVGILSSVVLVAINPAKRIAEAKDSQRRSDMSSIKVALLAYYTAYGRFPSPNSEASGGWDDSHLGVFIDTLRTSGYLKNVPVDPVNNASNRYSYYRYGAGSYGCPASKGAFVVLGVRNLESTTLRANQQPGAKEGIWTCPNRNWGTEFDYVWGEFEN